MASTLTRHPWRCSKCTLINQKGKAKCEICDNSAPAPGYEQGLDAQLQDQTVDIEAWIKFTETIPKIDIDTNVNWYCKFCQNFEGNTYFGHGNFCEYNCIHCGEEPPDVIKAKFKWKCKTCKTENELDEEECDSCTDKKPKPLERSIPYSRMMEDDDIGFFPIARGD